MKGSLGHKEALGAMFCVPSFCKLPAPAKSSITLEKKLINGQRNKIAGHHCSKGFFSYLILFCFMVLGLLILIQNYSCWLSKVLLLEVKATLEPEMLLNTSVSFSVPEISPKISIVCGVVSMVRHSHLISPWSIKVFFYVCQIPTSYNIYVLSRQRCFILSCWKFPEEYL